MSHRPVAAVAALLFAATLSAEEPVPALEDLADAPPPPEPVQSGEPLEPDVTIVQKEDRTVEEYRINGRLYMIKITPKIGKPYYLLDSDGDGKLEARMSEIYSDFVVPKWVLFSW
jgi:hypothetical protein